MQRRLTASSDFRLVPPDCLETKLLYPHFKRIIDSADGRELIPAIVEKGNPEDLVRFFTARANWCNGYPLIHDRYTYDAFEDLLPELSSHQRLALVPTAVTITENVSDEDFHTALMLLGISRHRDPPF